MKVWMKVIAAGAAVLVGAWLVATVLGLAASQAEQKRSRAELIESFEKQLADVRADGQANQAALEAANAQLIRLGEQPVEAPPVAVSPRQGPIGPVGPTGPRGPGCVEELGIKPCQGDAGADGTNGTDGTNGADSSIPGPRGPGCVEEVGLEKCKGDKGEPSTVPGPQGPAGRGIQSQVCGDDGRWHVTYTDGTTEDAGVCRVDPLPNGDPKP